MPESFTMRQTIVRAGSAFAWMSLLALCTALLPATGASGEQREIVLGITPERNLFEQHERYTLLAEHLSRQVGTPIRISIMSRYGNVVTQFANRKLDGAFLGSFSGALAHEKLKADALVRPVTPDGKASYHAHIIVRKDSGIRNVSDMRGKVMAFVDRHSSCGYIFPLAYFRSNGVHDIDDYLKESYFAGSHDAVIEAVLDGLADVGVAKNTVFDAAARKNPQVAGKLQILAESPRFPSHGLFVKTSLPNALKQKLRTAFLEMHRSPEGKAILTRMQLIGFEPAEAHADYEAVFDLAVQAGIDLKTYEFPTP